MRRLLIIVPLVFAVLMPIPASVAADLSDQVEQAGEDLDNANAQVAKAMSAYRKAQSELNRAKAIYSSALTKRNKAKKADETRSRLPNSRKPKRALMPRAESLRKRSKP